MWPAEELGDALFDVLVRLVLRHVQADEGEGGAGCGWVRRRWDAFFETMM